MLASNISIRTGYYFEQEIEKSCNEISAWTFYVVCVVLYCDRFMENVFKRTSRSTAGGLLQRLQDDVGIKLKEIIEKKRGTCDNLWC